MKDLPMRMPGFTSEAALSARMTARRTGIFHDSSQRAGNRGVVPQWFGYCDPAPGSNVCCACDADIGVCVCGEKQSGPRHPVFQ
jgi:hypothetical protein